MNTKNNLAGLEKAREFFSQGLESMSQRLYGPAADAFSAALQLAPERLSVLANYAAALLKLERYDLALSVVDRGLQIHGLDAQLLVTRGLIFFKQRRFQEACKEYTLALEADSDCFEALMNRAAALSDLNRPLDSLLDLAAARGLNDQSAELYLNEGVVFTQLQKPQRAIECFDKALALNPAFVEAQWNKALGLLRLGKLQEGWPLYESRWRWEGFRSPRRRFGIPQWPVDEAPCVEGLTLLVHAEQGLGDTLQFCRYVPELAAKGVKVVFEVQRPLVSLMRRLPGVWELTELGKSSSVCDAHIPLMSLPHAFRTTLQSIPTPTGYLRTESSGQENFELLFRGSGRPTIGITWRGNPEGDQNRSIPLDLFTDICSPEFAWIAIQQEILADEYSHVARACLQDTSSHLSTFDRTANLLQRCDLIITIDTSVAHLAGAMGREVWVLLPFVPDFRWMWDRGDSPWYSSMRLFRQPRLGDWKSVLKVVRAELRGRFRLT